MIEIINNLENEYMKNHNTYIVEDKLLYSFSKQDLYKLIKDTNKLYLHDRLLYAQNLYMKQLKYWNEDLNLLDREFIILNEYYFNWWEEIEKTKQFLERLKRFYRVNYEKNNKSYKRVDIKSIPIDKVISMYIRLPSNLNRNIRCPFHKEKTGSFRIYKNTNSFYCFGCHKWWDIVKFISLYENITSKEAFKKVLNLY